jgi:hypothetical protein
MELITLVMALAALDLPIDVQSPFAFVWVLV